MAPSINNGNKDHNLWVKHPDSNIGEITPGKSIVPKEMKPGKYEIASEEIVPSPIPHHPPGTEVYVANVGQETIVFVSRTDDDNNFILPSQQTKELVDDEYDIHSIHIPPQDT